MGVVYKAEDTTLERTVALKFLAQHLLDDEEAKERFLREAKAAAALDHPNICTVYEIAEVDGKTFISMAFLKGETFEDRIAKGPLSLKDALDIARQASEGLQAAHGEGIFHRDIKPANIQISPEGRATVMDFGLARLTEASRLTKFDTAMGTVAYMSPEQAQGMEVDGRTDLWSLGCVLYEMVSGQRPFQGQYDQALLYEIVHEEPAALTGLRTGVPVELEFVANKCLAKDRDDRYQTAKEIVVDLRTLAEKLKSGRSTILRTTNLTPAVPATMTASHTLNPAEALPPESVVMKRSSKRALQAAATVLAVAFIGLLLFNLTQAPPETPLRRFSFAPDGYRQSSSSISPDGKSILYRTGATGTDAQSRLWLRSLENESARELAGTAGAIRRGFWSPDSLSIGFGTGAELKRVSINGGDPITLCELPGSGQRAFVGGTWSPDGERIVFSSGLRLYEIPSRGGQPQLLFDASDSPRPDSVRPHFLPTDGGSHGLAYVAGVVTADLMLAVMDLETGERRELRPGSAPFYSSDGYLIHGLANGADDGLRALPFSLDTLEATSQSFPIDETGREASVSGDGTLVYTDRPAAGTFQTVWRSRTGVVLEAVGQPQPNIRAPSLSPDGQRVAVTSNESGNRDIWIHDLTRSTKTRLTFEDQPEVYPAWSPSGREIVYQYIGPPHRLMRRAADGTGEAVVLREAEIPLVRPDWSRDGRYLVYDETNPEARNDIRYIELGTDGEAGEPVMVLGSPADEQMAKLSPDGRFLAYESDESGRYEIYVLSFPGGDAKRQVSVNGGQQARWRSDGRELYYVEGDTLMAVSVSTESAITLGQPQQLFEAPGLVLAVGGTNGGYDVSADGERFLDGSARRGRRSRAPHNPHRPELVRRVPRPQPVAPGDGHP